MTTTSTLAMFGLMYIRTYIWDHVCLSETRACMALLMGGHLRAHQPHGAGRMPGRFQQTRSCAEVVWPVASAGCNTPASDRAIREAGVVTRTLKVANRRRGDRGERHVAEMLLDDVEPLLLEVDGTS